MPKEQRSKQHTSLFSGLVQTKYSVSQHLPKPSFLVECQHENFLRLYASEEVRHVGTRQPCINNAPKLPTTHLTHSTWLLVLSSPVPSRQETTPVSCPLVCDTFIFLDDLGISNDANVSSLQDASPILLPVVSAARLSSLPYLLSICIDHTVSRPPASAKAPSHATEHDLEL